jgi:hypothetical protein
MPEELITRRADKTTHTLTARDLTWAALVVMVYTPGLVPVAEWADILSSIVPPELASKGFVLLRGKIVLLCYVRQPTLI